MIIYNLQSLLKCVRETTFKRFFRLMSAQRYPVLAARPPPFFSTINSSGMHVRWKRMDICVRRPGEKQHVWSMTGIPIGLRITRKYPHFG